MSYCELVNPLELDETSLDHRISDVSMNGTIMHAFGSTLILLEREIEFLERE